METTQRQERREHQPDARDLLARVRRDDQQAWHDMVRTYQRRLMWCARQYRLSQEDAADAVQLTWMRCVEHVDQVIEPDQLGAWLMTICRRESMRLRSKRLQEVLVDDPGNHLDITRDLPHDVACDVVDRLEKTRQRRLLRKALTALTTRERDLIDVLLDLDPPSYRQISQELDMPIGSIGPVRMRAVNRLRAAIADAEAPRDGAA